MLFQRWVCQWPRTWPYVVFKKHHTELNDFYWSNALAEKNIRYYVKNNLNSGRINSILYPSALNKHRTDMSIADWQLRYGEFNNWTRLNGLMALMSYFETYLCSAIELALISNPGVVISAPKAVDGIVLLKNNQLPDIKNHITSCVKGSWYDRLSNYKNLFNSEPKYVKDNINQLEEMRKLRNGVGHSFGRSIDSYRDILLMTPLPLERLSEARFQLWLGIVDKCVRAIEDDLRINHIGAAEVLIRYHKQKNEISQGVSPGATFRNIYIPARQGMPPSEQYFKDAIAFYNSL